jgi:hypothetical protein
LEQAELSASRFLRDALVKGQVVITPDELARAACKLAHSLGIPVYIRDGRIYQNGPGLEFLPSTGARPTVPDISFDDDAFSAKSDEPE